MNQQNELQMILERLEVNSRKQLLHARLQTLFSIVCAIFCGTPEHFKPAKGRYQLIRDNYKHIQSISQIDIKTD